jgi:hypothetical protein
VIDCENSSPINRTASTVVARQPMPVSCSAGETDRSAEFSFWTKPLGRFPPAVLEKAPWEASAATVFLAKSNGLRHGGYALKGLSEDLRVYDDCRRFDRRVVRRTSADRYRTSRILSVTLLADLGVCQRAHWTHLTIAPASGRHRRLGYSAAITQVRRKRVTALTAAHYPGGELKERKQ